MKVKCCDCGCRKCGGKENSPLTFLITPRKHLDPKQKIITDFFQPQTMTNYIIKKNIENEKEVEQIEEGMEQMEERMV